MKKSKILNSASALFLAIGYGLNVAAIMRRDDTDHMTASLRALRSISDTCFYRSQDIKEDIEYEKKSLFYDVGYFEEGEND